MKTPLGIDHPIQDLDRSASGYFSSARWQHSYDYGTIFYLPANRWQAHIDVEHHVLGIELTPGIVKTRLNCANWNTDVTISGSLYHVAANSTIEVMKEQPIDFVLVTIDSSWADRLFREAGLTGATPAFAYNLVDPSLEKLARQVRRKFLQDEKDVASLASCLTLQAIDRLLNCSSVQRRQLRYRLAPYQMRAALDYINENLATQLSVEMLAQVTGLSGYFFAHAFTEMMGHSPHQYILDRRLARAREMITRTKSPLAEIAYAVGFSSQSHMTSTFCKRLGVTPKVLRQSLS